MAAYSPRIAFVTALMCVGLLSAAFYLGFISGLVPCAHAWLARHVRSDRYRMSAVSTAVLRISANLWSDLFVSSGSVSGCISTALAAIPSRGSVASVWA